LLPWSPRSCHKLTMTCAKENDAAIFAQPLLIAAKGYVIVHIVGKRVRTALYKTLGKVEKLASHSEFFRITADTTIRFSEPSSLAQMFNDWLLTRIKRIVFQCIKKKINHFKISPKYCWSIMSASSWPGSLLNRNKKHGGLIQQTSQTSSKVYLRSESTLLAQEVKSLVSYFSNSFIVSVKASRSCHPISLSSAWAQTCLIFDIGLLSLSLRPRTWNEQVSLVVSTLQCGGRWHWKKSRNLYLGYSVEW